MKKNYTSSSDYKNVWSLGFQLSGFEEVYLESENLAESVKTNIQRLTAAILRNEIYARGKYFKILGDNSVVTTLLQINHFIKLFKCVHRGDFNYNYLSNIFIHRSDLIDWCQKEYLNPPRDWAVDSQIKTATYDASDDDNDGWYESLTDRRKKRVGCLEIAKKLWEANPDWSYDRVYNDPFMKQYGNPNSFSPESFRKWARSFAPDQAKEGGRPIKNK